MFWRARRADGLGLTGADRIGLDWAKVIARKNGIVAGWSEGEESSLVKKGITVLRGHAEFAAPNELRIDGRTVTASRFVVATGSEPARPPIDGAEQAITSDELLELKELPARMVVIGGGAIAMEFAFAFARAGSKVTVLEALPHILSPADDEMRDELGKIARGIGIEIRANAKVARIAKDRTVEAEVAGAVERFQADVVLMATGRPAKIGGLGLERAGAQFDKNGVKVNEHLQSVSAEQIYAAGDAAGHYQLTPVAWYEGMIAGKNAVKGNVEKADYSVLPMTIFTIPALSQVGMTEAEARRRGLRVAINRKPFAHNPAAGVRDETEGLVKVIYDEESDNVLGVHILGPGSEDLIQVAAAAMRGGLKRREVGAMHYVFPTLGGALFDAMAGW